MDSDLQYERSLPQRMDALDKANDIRMYRANLKKDLREGRVDIYGLLINPPEKIETMTIFSLLMSVPKVGRVKASKMLTQSQISISKTFGSMTERQRNDLAVLLNK